ncbi:MAG TPA: response regulator [Methylomirabilota bacterium]|nr:response regulator [Methylomirabilota bacterium]
MTIVVVDDEPSIVRMCVQVLQSKGHTVNGFTKAADALAHLTATPTELLVVDYKMPELTGLEFIKKAWQVRPGMRVVMITAHGTREVMSKASESGVQTIVLKPFTPGELAEGVAKAVGQLGTEPPPPA